MKIKTILRNTAREFIGDNALTLGAALAYYAVFSVGPLLVIIIGVAGLVLSDQAARQQIVQYLQGAMGESAASVVQSMMTSQTRQGSLIATIVGVVMLFVGASGIFGQLKSALNIIWRVKVKSGRGIMGFILDRLVSITMVLGIGVLLLAATVVTTALSAFYDQIHRFMALPGFVVAVLNALVSLFVFTLLFGMIFKVLPDVKIAWRDVRAGALFTAVLFLIGEYLLGVYLGRKGASSAYGAAGSVVLLLMWIYYSSLILFAGAEFTKAYATLRGSKVEPGKHAVAENEPYFGLRRKPA